MNSLKISVILPIYNVEKYLDNCIQSIVNQKYKNLEIILVDDGSKDKCPQICDEWGNKDSRIKVIHKENAGLGMARNTGIENATGDYISFVDSDDMIDLNTYQECIEVLQDYKYDMVAFGYKEVNEENKIINEIIPTPLKNIYTGEEVQEVLMPNYMIAIPGKHNFNMNLSAWTSITKLDLIRKNNFRFVSERKIISEDIYSMLDLLHEVNSIRILDKSFYSYRVNPGSLSRVYRKDRFDKIKELRKVLFESYNEKHMINRIEYLFLSYSFGPLKQIASSNLCMKEKKIEINKVINDEVLRKSIKQFCKSDTLKKRIFYFCMLKRYTLLVYLMARISS